MRVKLQLQLDTEQECSHHCNATQAQKIGGNVVMLTPPPFPGDGKRSQYVNRTLPKDDFARHVQIETLRRVQSLFGYLEGELIRSVAKSLPVPLSQALCLVVIHYHQLSHKPAASKP
jgi:hypothetical protein